MKANILGTVINVTRNKSGEILGNIFLEGDKVVTFLQKINKYLLTLTLRKGV